MKKHALGLLAAGVLLASNAFANDVYRFDVGVTHQDFDGQKVTAVDGIYYFSDVAVNTLPRSEAAFYQHKSFVQAAYSQNKDIYRIGLATGQSISVDADALSVQGRLFIPDTMFMIGAGLTRVDVDLPGVSAETVWNASLGVAPAQGLLFWTEFTEDVDYADAINVNAKYVKPLADGTAYNLEGTVAKFDHGNQFTFGGDYFFDQNLSLGAVLSVYDFDGGSYNGYEIRAKNFFTNQFSLGLAYSNVDSEDGFSIEARFRF